MRWRVEISQCSGDNQLLRDELKEVSIRLHDETGTLFLTSDRFEAFKLQPRFMNWRLRVESILTEVTQDDPGIAMTFQVGPVP